MYANVRTYAYYTYIHTIKLQSQTIIVKQFFYSPLEEL